MQLLIEAELSPAVKRFEILIENVLLTAVPTRPLNHTKSDLSDFTSAGIAASNANWYSTEQVLQAPQQTLEWINQHSSSFLCQLGVLDLFLLAAAKPGHSTSLKKTFQDRKNIHTSEEQTKKSFEFQHR